VWGVTPSTGEWISDECAVWVLYDDELRVMSRERAIAIFPGSESLLDKMRGWLDL
jgi:hypothetical protein